MSLPECFDKGLKFGDVDQIKHIKSVRAEDAYEDEMREQGLHKWHVQVIIDGGYSQYVWAEDDGKAFEIADRDFDIDYANIEKDFVLTKVESDYWE